MGDFKQTAPEDNHSPTLILNVGGMKHETRVTTLQRMPTTRLADPNELALHFRPESRDHFFDRHPTVFAAILNFYRTGVLHVPQDVCGSTARMELQYWGIDERQMEDCCWLNYSTEHDNDEQLRKFGIDKASQMKVLASMKCHSEGYSTLGCRARVWQVIEEPFSSTAAKVYTAVSILVTLVSIFTMCAATHPAFIPKMTPKNYAELYDVPVKVLQEAWTDTEYVEYWSDDYWEYLDDLYEDTSESDDSLGNSISTQDPMNVEGNPDGEYTTNGNEPSQSVTDGLHGSGYSGDDDFVDASELRKKRRALKRLVKSSTSDYLKTKESRQKRSANGKEMGHKKLGKLLSVIMFSIMEILKGESGSDSDAGRVHRVRRHVVMATPSPTNGTSGNDTVQFLLGGHFRPPNTVLTYIDYVCYAFFTLEFIVRFIFCPKKLKFFLLWVTWLDLACIIPYYVEVTLDATNKTQRYQESLIDGLKALRIFRIFRILRIFRFNKGIRVLGYTLRSSLKEMFLMILFLMTGMLFFACLIYYVDKSGNVFPSIPDACWWALITMTTVGYGDMFPVSFVARIVGGMCAISGVLVIGFTVPVIVNNFLLFYTFLNAERFELYKDDCHNKIHPDKESKADKVPSEKKYVDREAGSNT